MRICVIGLGYIGFPTACLLADAGHQVIGVDVDRSLVDRLRRGDIHITDEEGVRELAHKVLERRALTISTSPVEADAFFICVPTPLREGRESNHAAVSSVVNGLREVAAGRHDTLASEPLPVGQLNGRLTVDLSYVRSAVHSIAPFVRSGNLIVLESTVPPGTTEHVVLPILESYGWDRNDVLLAYAPERVIPGAILRELVENDRVVGGVTPQAVTAAKDLYASLVKGDILTTDATTAEFVKLIENTFRDINIALANELARLAEHLGVDVKRSITMANRHPRVNILNPGPGVGGHCIPVDPNFLIACAPEMTPLIQAARGVNDGMVDHVVSTVDKLARQQSLRRWVILGAAYKANVADERNSASLAVAHRLMDHGLDIQIHDPHIERFKRPLDSLFDGAEGLLLLTDHREYLELDPNAVGRQVARRFLFDTRLVINVENWERHGFVVWRLGDGTNRREGVWS